MRRLLLPFIAVSLPGLALAACQPKADAPAPAASEAVGKDEASAPADRPAATRPVPFDALSKTAEAFTGAITLAALQPAGPNAAPAMRLEASNGLVYETELVSGGAAQATAIKWADIFNAPVDVSGSPAPGAATVDIHAVSRETVPPGLTNGGLCGKEKTTAIAMAIPIEIPGGMMMSIAAFKGGQWPPKSETDLCGIFNYAPPAPPAVPQ